MPRSILNDSQTTEVAQSTNMTGASLAGCKTVGFLTKVTVSTPSAGAFTAAASDICTKTAHGMKTGLKVQVSTTTTLPAGLSAATDYFVIYLTADTFKLATSLANANAGTAVDITDAGTGTHTITPTSIAGASVKLQASIDGTNYADIASLTSNITATANFLFNIVDPGYEYIRAVYTLTAGQISFTQNTLVKD